MLTKIRLDTLKQCDEQLSVIHPSHRLRQVVPELYRVHKTFLFRKNAQLFSYACQCHLIGRTRLCMISLGKIDELMEYSVCPVGNNAHLCRKKIKYLLVIVVRCQVYQPYESSQRAP